MSAREANFDGLVGLTHNYAGLSFGNVASQNNAASVANPRAAAKQGLRKMKALADMGFLQGVLAPQERPSMRFLRSQGFHGSDHEMILRAAKEAPAILAAASSASSMWVANAATVSPSADTPDGRVHFTPASLSSKLHRAIEAPTTTRVLQAVFRSDQHFAFHPPLLGTPALGDEGAANHTRFCADYGQRGVEFFVYGRSEYAGGPAPVKYPARQTLEASAAIARVHGLAADTVVLAQQHPDVIDAGVFHNDVIAVGNRDILFCHEHAFLDQPGVLAEIRRKLSPLGAELKVIEVPASAVSVRDAVTSYLFNSQLLTRPDGKTVLVVPQECRDNPHVSAYLDQLMASRGPIDDVLVFELRESMRNGGGPACLRLRVVLNEAEQAAVNPQVWINDQSFTLLDDWIGRHYRDRLVDSDLADPKLLDECRTALDELTRILNLGSVYDFQQAGA
ncbi:succinylarginine dihydrolase [Silvimonas terrae]|uniref:N-succinylarginine dihydrolase n=1 Tax=Silvimonas terrae TaxID=300266 RepID=A0A840RAL3_9NEIS|nr:N-succinylarginine dihydrolase [Silvimonas terrae]MBB5189341.1 succinylarginine dihydrolase [Silvimonas terrae]